MDYQIGCYIDLPKGWWKKISRIKKYLVEKGGSEYAQEPHISLYMAKFKKDNFFELWRNLKDKIKQYPFSISISMPKEKDDFYYLRVKPKKPIKDLHLLVLQEANKLREGLIRKKDLKRLKTHFYSQKQTEYVKRYGFVRVLDLFLPHITLGNPNRKVREELHSYLNNKINTIGRKSFTVKEIILVLFEEEKLDKPLILKKIKLKK